MKRHSKSKMTLFVVWQLSKSRMTHTYRSALSLLCIAALAACAAEVPANENGPEAQVGGSEALLVGSYPLPNGGELDVYELAPGDFIAGERLPKGVEETNMDGEALDLESLPALYMSMTGETEVPAELLEAEERRLSFLDAETLLADEPRDADPAFSETLTPAIDQADVDFEAKEAERGVANFQLYRCRGLDTTPSKNFNICLTERTNDATVSKYNIHGSYSAARVYRGTITYSMRYQLSSWSTAFSITLYEGQTYHMRKVGPVRDYDVEARIRNAAGAGYHLALIGTSNRGEKGCYSDYESIACKVIAGTPL